MTLLVPAFQSWRSIVKGVFGGGFGLERVFFTKRSAQEMVFDGKVTVLFVVLVSV